MVCHHFQNKKCGKLSYPGQAPFQPSGVEENADKYDAFIQGFLAYTEKKELQFVHMQILTLHTVFLKGRGIISLLPLHNENHIQIC